MGSLFRSEEMEMGQMYLQQEAAFNCVIELGELGLVEFRDLNPDVNAFQRRFVNEVRRCDEMERKLRFFEKEIKKDGMPIIDLGENPDAPQAKEMVDLEATLEKLENEVMVVNRNAEELKRTYLNLTELHFMLRKTQQFFDEIHDAGLEDESIQLLGEEGFRIGGQHTLKLEFVSGVILRDRLPAFERMLWRICRGNVFLRQAEIEEPLEDPATGDKVYKSVFIIFFQGDQLKNRVKKVCEGFHATLFPCPETPPERREMITGVISRIEDLNTVLNQTIEHRRLILIAAAKNIRSWFVKIHKLKSIYSCLNMFNFDVTAKCLISEVWYPKTDKDRIMSALKRGTVRSGATVDPILVKMHSKKQLPTFNRTNKFTSCFQEIVDSYGVAKYREVNPAPFTIITFPFIFAVMFGDAGHGLLMFLAALAMVWKERQILSNKNQNEIFSLFFTGRYIILLMGLFSIYTGMLYNDAFAKSMNFFGSAWTSPDMSKWKDDVRHIPTVPLSPWSEMPRPVYPFGIDPVWQVASNKIIFLNSYKMKMAVIIGVGQMLFGVVLSFFNHSYFKNTVSIFCQFIPEVIFLLSIFGYMNAVIIFKWIYFDYSNASCAPSVLMMLINMFMFNYPTGNCQTATFYPGQKAIQISLLVVALLCIPWMLAIKPYILYKRHQEEERKKRFAQVGTYTSNQTLKEESGDQVSVNVEHEADHGDHDDEHGEFAMGDVIVHQCIHTIEYCLGSISHTASYLRLWALSLAHGQLSEVLWNMVMVRGLAPEYNYYGAFFLVPLFAFWAVLTVAVLLLMEGLSAFLHALRLHWVEFQSKFYAGSGHAFSPFSFKLLIEAAESEQ